MIDLSPDDAQGDTEPDGDRLWDDWETPPRVPDVPVLHLDGFDGPMDVLLDLAERQLIDLGRMSILALAEQFVAALERLADRVALEQRAEWLILATRLVLLRSKLLFPATPEAAAEAAKEAEDAARWMDTRLFLRAATEWLQTRPQLGHDVFARTEVRATPRERGYVALMEACLVVLQGGAGRVSQQPAYHHVISNLWRVSDALARIRVCLTVHPAGGDLSGFLPTFASDEQDHEIKARAAVASTFLAGLELAREGALVIDQGEDFGPVGLISRVAPEV